MPASRVSRFSKACSRWSLKQIVGKLAVATDPAALGSGLADQVRLPRIGLRPATIQFLTSRMDRNT